MPKIPKPLSDKEINALKPSQKRQKIADGGGLYVFVDPSGRKYFVFQFTSPLDKKRKMIVLGDYPALSLKNARQKRLKFKSDLINGIDVKLKNSLDLNATFEAVANRYLDIKSANVSSDYNQKERRNLELHIMPFIGKREFLAQEFDEGEKDEKFKSTTSKKS